MIRYLRSIASRLKVLRFLQELTRACSPALLKSRNSASISTKYFMPLITTRPVMPEMYLIMTAFTADFTPQ